MSAPTLATPERSAPSLSLVDASFFSNQEINSGGFIVRLARTSEEVDAALKLRFEVFNLELGAGLASSFLTGRDSNEFDSTSQHLILIDRLHRHVIGTYRLRTYEIARTVQGFSSSHEFDLTALPHEVLANAIKLGRVCIAKAYRNSRAHMLLWKGLALSLMQNDKKYVFGSLSLATQDPMQAGRIFDQLAGEGHLHPEFRIMPKTGFKCFWYRMPEGRRSEVAISSWFRICLRFGMKLCGPPAINRQLRTIDFPVFLDVKQLGHETRRILLDEIGSSRVSDDNRESFTKEADFTEASAT
jgi:putative hemolysin